MPYVSRSPRVEYSLRIISVLRHEILPAAELRKKPATKSRVPSAITWDPRSNSLNISRPLDTPVPERRSLVFLRPAINKVDAGSCRERMNGSVLATWDAKCQAGECGVAHHEGQYVTRVWVHHNGALLPTPFFSPPASQPASNQASHQASKPAILVSLLFTLWCTSQPSLFLVNNNTPTSVVFLEPKL